MCDHLHFKFICTTEFGHGDSSTQIVAACKNCGQRGKVVWQYGWPATYENMREAQKNLQGE